MIADKEISYTNLKALIEKSKELLLVDVRSKDEVDRGRIPGSIHIPGKLHIQYDANGYY